MSFGQEEFHINDRIEPYNIFNSINTEMLDTAHLQFKKAKRNVLQYCYENLNFNIDSTSVLYSCREYMDFNPNYSIEERNLFKQQGLKYQFFISFKLYPNIFYHSSFYLDTSMKVIYTSQWLFNIPSEKI